MKMRPFFSSLFDTGERSPRDRSLASALLRVACLSPEGAILPALQGANAAFVIDDCAKDDAFIKLVSEGVVKFRPRYGGASPLRIVEELLGSSGQVYVGAWPELLPDVDYNGEKRAAAHAYLNGDTGAPCDAESQSRIERVKEVESAIKFAVAHKNVRLEPELARGYRFKELYSRQLQLHSGRMPRDLALLLTQIASDQSVDTNKRTSLYYAIRGRTEDARLVKAARAFVNGVTHRVTAELMSMDLHTAEEDPSSQYAHQTVPSDGRVFELDSRLVDEVGSLQITWRDINALHLSPHGTHGAAARAAVSSLAEAHAKVHLVGEGGAGVAQQAFSFAIDYSKGLGAATTGTVASGALLAVPSVVAFTGTMAALLSAFVLSGVGAIAGKKLSELYSERLETKAEKILNSFLDA